VGEIDDAHDAEDQRQTTRDQEQQQAVLNAIEDLDQPFHGTLPSRGHHRGAARKKKKRGRLPPP